MNRQGTVLVVDNETDQLAMMKGILGRIGFEAWTTDDPQQALEWVQRQGFSVVLIDLIMPELDGTELCERIKRLRPGVRVYAYSGHVHLFRPEQLQRAGFDGTIAKPATMDEIKTVLCRYQDTRKT